jgi:hypothetical protein
MAARKVEHPLHDFDVRAAGGGVAQLVRVQLGNADRRGRHVDAGAEDRRRTSAMQCGGSAVDFASGAPPAELATATAQFRMPTSFDALRKTRPRYGPRDLKRDERRASTQHAERSNHSFP